MKYLMWALVGLLLFAACTQEMPETTDQKGIGAQLLNLQQYQQGNSFAFECNTTGFEPHTFLWNFGDGTERETKYKGVAHTYFKSGTYTVSCTATDDVQNETSTTTVDVEVTGSEQYDGDVLGDLDLIDLLSDTSEMNTTNNTPFLNWTHNTTYVPEEEYDYAFDFEFEDEEAPPRRQTNTTNTSGQVSNSTNHSNSTGAGTLIPTNTSNATNNTTNSTNTTDPFEWPELNLSDENETELPPVVPPPMNESEKEDDTENKKDKGNEEEAPEEKDTAEEESDEESNSAAEVKVSYGKLKKEFGLKGMKVKI